MVLKHTGRSKMEVGDDGDQTDVRPSTRDPVDDGSESESRRSTQHTGHSWTIILFLYGDMIGPDIMSQELLKAGDVERNPGPSTRATVKSKTVEGGTRTVSAAEKVTTTGDNRR